MQAPSRPPKRERDHRTGQTIIDDNNPQKWTARRASPLMEYFVPRANNLDEAPNVHMLKKLRTSDDLDPKPVESDGTENIEAKSTGPKHYGGITVGAPAFQETIDDLLKYKLSVPKLEELGMIDIQALSMSLRSGIRAEVRLGLDTIVSLSIMAKQPPLALDECGDLVESLIDCASDQVELLAEHAAEVSDALLINSYEETVRGCKVENETLQTVSEFGTLEHDLDRAVDRLICVTTILRNFSFFESSHKSLADPIVIRMMTTVMRFLGTRNMLLRTHSNALDFSKDVVIFLSQMSHRLDLTSKDEALCILHFLLSFAPSPEPNHAEKQVITFAPYVPPMHRYFPHAVDSLAKLLARDPNRAFYRSIFANDSSSSPPYDLLTRTFGLAIAAIPEIGSLDPTRVTFARVAFLVQGLLASEILIGMIPASENDLAHAWLASQDGFASKLMKMLSLLVRRPQPPLPRHRGSTREEHDIGFSMVTSRGLAVLRQLAERAKDADGAAKKLPFGVLPHKQSVLNALRTDQMDPDVVRQLCAFSGLDT